MLRDIYLHGTVGREFGRHWRLDIVTPAEAVRALCTLRPQLKLALRRGWWRVIVGPPRIRNAIELSLLNMQAGAQPIHIVPATPPHGGDAMDVGKIVVGVALVAVAIAFPVTLAAIGPWAAGAIAGVGLSLTFGGVAGLLTPDPSREAQIAATDMARPEDRPSFMFNGVRNNAQQGGPVPVVLGTHLVGSVLVAGSINVEDIS